ncbi:hydrogenase maturation protease [Shewanella sp. A25]|nr:hydrogenase maturation protease [Shewanella shenzhenensis]
MNILLLGIGNVLGADLSIGVHFIQYIASNYQFRHQSHRLDFIDGSTLTSGLFATISQYDYVIVVDTLYANGIEAGAVYLFDFDSVPKEIDWQGSAHEVELQQTLHLLEMLGDRPKTFVLGVTPMAGEQRVSGLGAVVKAALPLMEKALLNHLVNLGFSVSRASL